jgi:DDE superfamily endonuclease
MPQNGLTYAAKMPWPTQPITLVKKRYTRKNTVIASQDRYIHFLGNTVCGSIHDYQLLKNELDVNLGLFDGYKTLVDLGYLGMDKAYFSDTIHLPHRKPRQSKLHPTTKLSQQHKQENKVHAQIRIKVENALAGVKRLGAVSQVYRNKSLTFNDLVMCLACSIWNLHLKITNHSI